MDTFEIDQRARKCLAACLPDSWSISAPVDDVGLDYWVQITDSGRPTGVSFFIQLKGTTSPRFVEDSLTFILPTRKIIQYLEMSLPVLLVVCDVPRCTSYYAWIRDQMYQLLCPPTRNPAHLLGRQSITLRIPRAQALTPTVCHSVLMPYLRAFHVRHVQHEDKHIALLQQAQNVSKGLVQFDRYLSSHGLKLGRQSLQNAKHYYVAARLLQNEGRHREAITYLDMTNAICPVPESYLCQCFSYIAADDLPRAIEACKGGLALDPEEPYLLSMLGNCYFASGQLAEAYECHVRAATINDEDALLVANAAATLEYLSSTCVGSQRDELLQRSLAYYEKAVAIDPGNDFILTDMGLVYHKLYKYPQAVQCLAKAIAINPGNITAGIRLARAALADGDLNIAHDAVERMRAAGVNSQEVSSLAALVAQYRASGERASFAWLIQIADEAQLFRKRRRSRRRDPE